MNLPAILRPVFQTNNSESALLFVVAESLFRMLGGAKREAEGNLCDFGGRGKRGDQEAREISYANH